jgi:hypothetical protein
VATAAIANGSLHLFSFSFIFVWQGAESLFACFSLYCRSVLVKEAKPALPIGREHASKLAHLIFNRFFNRCRLPVGWLRPVRAELAGRAYQLGRAESRWMMASAS